MTVVKTLAFLSVMNLYSVADAARPMLTDDARTVDEGQCQLESWGQRTRTGHELWALPACSGGRGVEWAVGGRHAPRDSDSPWALMAQYKQVLRDVQPSEVGLAVNLGLNATAGRLRPYAVAPMSWSNSTEDRFVHLNLGLAGGPDGSRPNRPWGLAIEQRLGANLWAIAERYAQSSEHRLVQGGLRWWVRPNVLQVDATWAQEIRGSAAPARQVSIGVRWLFAPPARSGIPPNTGP